MVLLTFERLVWELFLNYSSFQKSIISLAIVPTIATYATLGELFNDISAMSLKRARTEREKKVVAHWISSFKSEQ